MRAKFIVGVILCLVSFQLLSKEYIYVDYSVPESFEEGKVRLILDVSSGQIKSSDWVYKVTICNADSKYFCFSYPAVSFYAPKSKIFINQQWVAEGISFRVARRESVHIFDINKNVWVIKAVRSGRNDFFYYSETDGLIAIKHDEGDGRPTRFFMIVGDRGFPQ